MTRPSRAFAVVYITLHNWCLYIYSSPTASYFDRALLVGPLQSSLTSRYSFSPISRLFSFQMCPSSSRNSSVTQHSFTRGPQLNHLLCLPIQQFRIISRVFAQSRSVPPNPICPGVAGPHSLQGLILPVHISAPLCILTKKWLLGSSQRSCMERDLF